VDLGSGFEIPGRAGIPEDLGGPVVLGASPRGGNTAGRPRSATGVELLPEDLDVVVPPQRAVVASLGGAHGRIGADSVGCLGMTAFVDMEDAPPGKSGVLVEQVFAHGGLQEDVEDRDD